MVDEDRNRRGRSYDDFDKKRDLILAPNEYAYVSDETNGQISVFVGPKKISLESTDIPVVFDIATKRFRKVGIEEGKQTFCIAPEGWYVTLKNPADGNRAPQAGSTESQVDLNVGKKINIPGPVSFPLWPGQMAKVVRGHHLRSNHYLVVRCYDENAAKESWEDQIVKPQTDPSEDPEDNTVDEPTEVVADEVLEKLTTGKLMVIKGTEVSFYIPPTGIEVVADRGSYYIRDAVTLERLEYCILLDEDGNKRYVKGPDVVFPEPTEEFIERKGQKKFRAIELNQISGVYIKVIADYEEMDESYKAGDELFITGKDMPIYFPREEHAIIKYGDQEVHYATAIPAGETRYLMDRLTGEIELIEGPEMLLPDPRKKVLVRRVLDSKHVSLWYPGNQDALVYNQNLLNKIQLAKEGEDYITEQSYRSYGWDVDAPMAMTAKEGVATGEGIVSDDFTRKETYTKPRTITLDTKYEGAPKIQVWTGYAVNVISDTGTRKVVEGPATVNLKYDEFLEAMELSTGTPKSPDSKIKTVYLRVKNNKVSDIVQAETKDLCNVQITLSYRVSFTGDSEIWFDVEDYVGFLTDHMRSLLRNLVKQHGVEDFYNDSINIIRDAILGEQSEEGRAGRLFVENGMLITDVEVLNVKLGDSKIAALLQDAEIEAVHQNLKIAKTQRDLEFTVENERIKRESSTASTQTILDNIQKSLEVIEKTEEKDLRAIEHTISLDNARKEAELATQGVLGQIQAKELEREKASRDQELALVKREQDLDVELLAAKVQAFVDKAKAIQPELVMALQTLGDKLLAGELAENMSVQAMLGGKSLVDVIQGLLKGTALGNRLDFDDPEFINKIGSMFSNQEDDY